MGRKAMLSMAATILLSLAGCSSSTDAGTAKRQEDSSSTGTDMIWGKLANALEPLQQQNWPGAVAGTGGTHHQVARQRMLQTKTPGPKKTPSPTIRTPPRLVPTSFPPPPQPNPPRPPRPPRARPAPPGPPPPRSPKPAPGKSAYKPVAFNLTASFLSPLKAYMDYAWNASDVSCLGQVNFNASSWQVLDVPDYPPDSTSYDASKDRYSLWPQQCQPGQPLQTFWFRPVLPASLPGAQTNVWYISSAVSGQCLYADTFSDKENGDVLQRLRWGVCNYDRWATNYQWTIHSKTPDTLTKQPGAYGYMLKTLFALTTDDCVHIEVPGITDDQLSYSNVAVEPCSALDNMQSAFYAWQSHVFTAMPLDTMDPWP